VQEVEAPHPPVGDCTQATVQRGERLAGPFRVQGQPAAACALQVIDDHADGPVQTVIVLLHRLLARRCVFLSETERAALGPLGHGRRVAVVPLYIDALRLSAGEARVSRGGIRVGVAGFIHQRKKPLLAVSVLAHLPEGSTLTFIGGSSPSSHAIEAEIKGHANELGVLDRVEITGYVEEGEFHRRLAGIDIGLALYGSAATSASLNTLLAARRPVVASNLPVFIECAKDVPAVVAIAESDDPAAIAGLVCAVHAAPTVQRDVQIEELLRRRSVRSFAQEFLLQLGT
jgi:glycosyltransferase involved in cell wall biosynthesis